MNAIGAGLVWSGVQVTLLVLAGGVVYAVLRRRSPAAGSLAALALLVIAIGFSVLAVSPWPNWWRIGVVSASTAQQSASDAKVSDASGSSAKTDGGNTGESAASHRQPIATESFDAVTWARTFWKNVVDGFNEPTPSGAAPASRWPSFAAWLLIVGVGFGLARLTIGLFAVERYRRRTMPVNDVAVDRVARCDLRAVGMCSPDRAARVTRDRLAGNGRLAATADLAAPGMARVE